MVQRENLTVRALRVATESRSRLKAEQDAALAEGYMTWKAYLGTPCATWAEVCRGLKMHGNLPVRLRRWVPDTFARLDTMLTTALPARRGRPVPTVQPRNLRGKGGTSGTG